MIVLYGCGDRSHVLYRFLKKEKISVDAVAVSREYYYEEEQMDFLVYGFGVEVMDLAQWANKWKE